VNRYLMSVLYGYGEDALTYWALNNRLGEVLDQLEDPSSIEECIAFFKPGIGRGGRSHTSFGEFDAILVTPLCMYLMEARWSRSSEFSTAGLSHGQIERHRNIEWIAINWMRKEPFHDFVKRKADDFRDFTGGKELPPIGSEVFKRLEFVIGEARRVGRGSKVLVKHVVLILMEEGSRKVVPQFPRPFHTVKVYYKKGNEAQFFPMDDG
jgi:hypothetical protein